jgi:Skp family chaperone for outer membrane proteins
MHTKVVKYEEYLKTLMGKYTELKEERDQLKLKLRDSVETNTNKYSTDVLDEKKKELIRLSNEVQEKIRRFEEMQEASANVDD